MLRVFNHRFTQPNDHVWGYLDASEPANADLTTLTEEMPVSCRDNTFTEFEEGTCSGKGHGGRPMPEAPPS